MNGQDENTVRPTSPLDRFVRRLQLLEPGDMLTCADYEAFEYGLDEIERLRKDAERYRWLLRNVGYGISRHQHAELYLGDRIVPAPDHISQLSAAIDAAMLMTPNTGVKAPAVRRST